MARLERDPDDRKRKVLAGVGAIVKTGGWLSEREELRADDGRVWVADRKGWKGERVFTDSAGSTVARWEGAGAFSRGGTLIPLGGGPSALLRPSSRWKERYDLEVDGREVATVATTTGGAMDVELADPSTDAMLVLAAAWLVKEAGEDTTAAAAAAT